MQKFRTNDLILSLKMTITFSIEIICNLYLYNREIKKKLFTFKQGYNSQIQTLNPQIQLFDERGLYKYKYVLFYLDRQLQIYTFK